MSARRGGEGRSCIYANQPGNRPVTDQDTNPNIQKAVAFFTQAGLSRLLVKLRQKYIELGQVGGQVLLEDSTPGERRNIASFLGRPPYPNASFKVRLADIEKAISHSFGSTLPDVLEAFFPDQPLLTRQEQRAAHSLHQAEFRAQLLSIAEELPDSSRGRDWLLHGQHGQEWLFSRYKNAPADEQEQQLKLARYIASALDQLPGPDTPKRLALFAQQTSGDPHSLDPDRPAGRLFLLALNDLTKDAPSSLQDRAQELRLYTDAGLLVDTISSSVAVFNLASAMYSDGTRDPLPQAAGERVLLLPLRQLLEWQSAIPSTTDIYIFENPQVFEAVISELDPDIPLPTLICTSGWPSTAAIKLLDLLVAQSSNNRLHYSGDFDLKGLQIASYLLTRYPQHCHPWRFDPHAYTVAMQAGGSTAPANELNMLQVLPDVFTQLITAMQEKKKWAYQEGIVHLLTEDVRKNLLSRSIRSAQGDKSRLSS